MSVFDDAIKTATGKHAGATDKDLPNLGALDPKNMTSATAVSGTTGTDAKLIHGDRWQEIKGNQTENIEKNLKTDIKENENWEVHENLVLKINGTTKDTRVEDVKEYFLSDSTFEYILTHTDHHHEKDHQINPTQTFDILNIEGEYKLIDLAIKSLSIEGKGVGMEAHALKMESTALAGELFGGKFGAGVAENTATVLHAREDALEERLKGMENEIKGLQSQVAVTKVIIMPVRVGLCVAIHIDSPFA